MNIQEALSRFDNKKVVVVGDVILDSYIYGDVERINIEAPVPIVKVNKKIFELGGAANVAANISSLGGKAFLFGYTGKDTERQILLRRLEEKGINYELFPILKKTIQKTRIIGNNQQITRVDEELYEEGNEEVEEKLAGKVKSINPDVIVISDYAKGCLTGNLMTKIKGIGARIIVDPKPKNKGIYTGVYLVKPNLKEAREMVGEGSATEIGKRLQEELRSNILLTLGKDGMSLFKEGKAVNIPTQVREVFDIIGAGDTVVATLALALASGLGLEESALLANHAAGIVIEKAGTSVVFLSELRHTIEKEHGKIKLLKELKCITQDFKRKNKKIVWTNGCFDLLHVGHIDYLKKAKTLGDVLIVGLNSDESVRNLKGENRPIISEKERAEILSSLEFIDYVTIFSELTAENCLKELKPDVYVKGEDYDENKIDQNEKRIVESYAGKISFIPINHLISTSKIIDKIKNHF